jgi:hypothetical protein
LGVAHFGLLVMVRCFHACIRAIDYPIILP